MKKRLIWIDLLKLFGLLSVILGHMASPLSVFIYSWHMPFFFFISGFFLKSESSLINLISATKKEFNRLLIPFFVFSIFGIIVEGVKRILLERGTMDYISEFKGVFYYMDVEGLSNHYGYVLWFLSALFIGKCLFSVVSLLSKNNSYLLVISAIVFYLFSFEVELPFSISVGFNAFFWLVLGYIYFHHFSNISLVKQIAISVILLLAVYMFLGHIPRLNMAHLMYEYVLLNVYWSVGIIGVLIPFTKLFYEKYGFDIKIVGMLSKYFMFIFIFHTYTNNIAYLVTTKFFDGYWLVEFMLGLILIGMLVFVRSKLPRPRVFRYV